jgi:uncharacterized protein (DUF488 family)
METKPLYTIGHGTRKIEDFTTLLLQHGIEYLLDVRSKPYSRFNPQYRQQALKASLEEKGIQYVFMGDTLGGRPQDPSCYDKEGNINYDILKTKEYFLQGIERLKIASAKEVKAALMCSESNPCHCHRSKLIGKALSAEKIQLLHIDEKGQLKDQQTVMREINKGFPENDLFGE